ncbi:MAG: ceramide glucosyltransferase [Nitrospiraceae bacterium]|nr:ceramide glucosyltransferase [Nitrospiraceae bacterium]
MALFWIFAGLTALGLAGCFLQIFAVRSYLGRPSRKGLSYVFPPVSILKPLKGLDDNLFDNLESFCNLDYPEYEIIFSLQDRNDHACKVARKIAGKYPDRARVIVEKCNEGLNPKVNNLIPAYRASKYGHVLISDSNVLVDRDYLKEITARMQESGAGLVTNLVKGVGGRSIGSIFENLHLNSFVMGSVCFLEKFMKMPCVVGKSMLMSKEDLEDIGGFRAVKDVLAEDYLIGKLMHDAGKKVVLSHYMVQNMNQYWGIKKFLNRHARWGKLRWRIGGVRYISELIGNPVFISLIPLLFSGASAYALVLASVASLAKTLGDWYLGKKTGSGINALCYALVPFKDLVIGILWFVPVLSKSVVWRGNRYLIGKDSFLQPYPERTIWAFRYRVISAIKTRFA